MGEPDKTVLILDDETSVRQSLADFLEDRLWRVLLAESGEQAIKLLETESPHGAIVDIRLGGMDGDQFIRRANRIIPDIAFVICTGSPEYRIPADLSNLSNVSETIFRKPITNIAVLAKELLLLMAKIKADRSSKF
jgi:response regulator RpfG family c-di-GMP phosphodiesterase